MDRSEARGLWRPLESDFGQGGAASAEESPVYCHIHAAAGMWMVVVGLWRGYPVARCLLRPDGNIHAGGLLLCVSRAVATGRSVFRFRSLASEREDGTFELLSISTLSSRQIVMGKLCSSILQMLVYYSALAPCIAFTYLLRGVDLIVIALLLAITFLQSTLLSSIGLVFAGLSRSRQWQSLVSVLLLLGLVVWGVTWASIIGSIADSGVEDMPVDDADFWIVMLGVLTAGVMYIVLAVYVAAAQNSFRSDNRSTKIRIVLTIQTLLFIGWVAYTFLRVGQPYALLFCLIVAAIHWSLYGMLLTGESAELSPRVKRQLPQTTVGRLLFTWFNPGAGTGYVFAVGHVLLMSGFVLGAVAFQDVFNFPRPEYGSVRGESETSLVAVLILCYITFYLGLGQLLIRLIPNRAQYGLVLPFLIQLLITLAGAGIPLSIEMWLDRRGRLDYSALQAPNWMWTIVRAIDDNDVDEVVFVTLIAGALTVFVANLWVIRKQLGIHRAAAPARVQQDDAETNPAPEPEAPVNPLDTRDLS